jgi:protein gp37
MKSSLQLSLLDEPEKRQVITLEDGRKLYIVRSESKAQFNSTNEMVDWAWWTWNPVTGCWHGCPYCYARDIANRFYETKFEPTFYPGRLNAPKNMKPMSLDRVKNEAKKRRLNLEDARIFAKNVFTCSMADLFGKWVPDDWILQVFQSVASSPEWNFLFLTKFPQRLQEINDRLGGFPNNVWVGTTVDTQSRVSLAEKSFQTIQAKVKWLSIEPMLEPLNFESLDMFDLIAIGGQSRTSQEPEFQPEWSWVENLMKQARASNTSVYFKENLRCRPKELPLSFHQESTLNLF